jgi:penicillin amidase
LLKKAPQIISHPFESSLLDGILRDSSYKFLDNIETATKETLADDATAAFIAATNQLKTEESNSRLTWAAFKATRISHLAKLEPFSRLNLPVGGGSHCINATKSDHGPSWRMIVSLTDKTEAWGVYPGGQSGSPGSKFYDNFVDQWVAGKYYPLWMMKTGEEKDSRIKWTMSFSN